MVKPIVKRVATALVTILALSAMSVPYAQAEDQAPAAAEQGEGAKAPKEAPVEWEKWRAHNAVEDRASLQRGARNFMNYCIGCHSLKFERYQRMADDLKIPTSVLQANLIPPGSNNLDYITTSMPAADAQAWFGKVPPDLSLIARSKGVQVCFRPGSGGKLENCSRRGFGVDIAADRGRTVDIATLIER